ncbi:MAG: 50S ribosomal protein L22 [Minisyncoccia bacterium]
MAEARAILKNYRQTPRKTRRVGALVRGKRVEDAYNILDFAIKRPAAPIKKLISSAVANAKAQGLSVEGLYVKEIRIDQAQVMKRIRPASRGSAHPVKKRSSHVIVILTTDAPKKKSRRAVNPKIANKIKEKSK